MAAAAAQSVENSGAVGAEEGVFGRVGGRGDGRGVELAGGDAAVLVAFEAGEVAR